MGPKGYLTTSDCTAIDSLISVGKYIEAIKLYRQETGKGLKESKLAIDHFKEDCFLTATSLDLIEIIRAHCLSFRFFEDSDDEIRRCFAQGAERCIERRNEALAIIRAREDDVERYRSLLK